MEGHPPREKEAGLRVGVDIEKVARFRQASAGRLVSRVMTPREISYCRSKSDAAPRFAGVFAAKEAVLKALGGEGEGIASLADFEVVHGKKGEPEIRYQGRNERIRPVQFRVSISHTEDDAVAVAIAFIPS